ncbi:uncharacterized protein EDB91DRAFT_1273568 [Suillus paluster]|uniref:uncharacterized protein n=1 Tax=Suillus paluster TaxID=48578 RepID=UPI001B883A57|nr:uncharacterized protein EDB91DRAFT_1273568 [Suillus paluster]KAG1744079.1 hypothetical protein EDB91DRAFT_1273568 [Suillus paluster]
MTSIFVLGYAFGPFLLGPLSEIYGQSRVLQLANAWYLGWNLACGFAKSEAQSVVAFSVISGDRKREEKPSLFFPWLRYWDLLLDLSLAPGLLNVQPGNGCSMLLPLWMQLFNSCECFTLKRAVELRKTMDTEKGPYREVRTVFDGEACQMLSDDSDSYSWKTIMSNALKHPFQLFFHEPIIVLLSIYMAYLYGILYRSMLASQLNAKLMDKIYVYFKNKNGGVGKPEFRLSAMFPGSLLLPMGMLIGGPDVGSVLVGAGIVLNFQCIQTYIVDSFMLYAASATLHPSCSSGMVNDMLRGFGHNCDLASGWPDVRHPFLIPSDLQAAAQQHHDRLAEIEICQYIITHNSQFDHLAETYFDGFEQDLGKRELGYTLSFDHDLDVFAASIGLTKISIAVILNDEGVKIELMEQRMKVVKKQADTIADLEIELSKARKQERMYEEAMEQLQADLDTFKQDNAKLTALAAASERQAAGTQLVDSENIKALRGTVRFLCTENSYLKGPTPQVNPTQTNQILRPHLHLLPFARSFLSDPPTPPQPGFISLPCQMPANPSTTTQLPPVIPAAFMARLKHLCATEVCMCPALEIYLADLFTATRHLGALDAMMLTARARQDAEVLFKLS